MTHRSGFDVYRMYLALKQHFTRPEFDFFKYEGRVNVKAATYEKRNDFYFFETLARKYDAIDIQEYLLASFICAENPGKVWIGDIKRNGKDNWLHWQKQMSALSYNFDKETSNIRNALERSESTFNDLFTCDGGHPLLLRLFIRGEVSLETLMILDMILGFMLRWDGKLTDPLWTSVSLKIKKYKPFVSIPVSKYRTALKEKFV